MTELSSIYLHVPYCVHLCDYCDFFKKKLKNSALQNEQWEIFENNLHEQMQILLVETQEKNITIMPLKTFYMGGGTPSLWGIRGIKFLINFFEKYNLSFTSDAQVTLEVDPGTITAQELKAWKNWGVNRFSLGIQSMDKTFLQFADRLHGEDEILKTLNLLQENDCDFSVDFLLGLPYSEKFDRQIIDELEAILKYQPKHLSLYILTVKENYPHYHFLPSDDFVSEEYLAVSRYLESKGFKHYEVSNFAKPHFESRHNYIYWKGLSYLGLGPSATGQWRVSANQIVRYRFSNAFDTKRSFDNVNASEFDIELSYMRVRTLGWSFEEWSELNKNISEEFIARGWVEFKQNHVFTTAAGKILADFLIDKILANH